MTLLFILLSDHIPFINILTDNESGLSLLLWTRDGKDTFS